MKPHVAIIDTGAGNLRSVERAIAHAGCSVVVTGDADLVRKADKVVVPGQGAFGHFVQKLEETGLRQALCEAIASGRPYLGICLGLQALYESSEENGPVAGLGILGGHACRFRPTDPTLKVPHMGWNRVRYNEQKKRDPLLTNIANDSYFYFVHSYHVQPTDLDTVILTCDYGKPFPAAIRKDNIFACQFHPEKSQSLGLRLLQNFVEQS